MEGNLLSQILLERTNLVNIIILTVVASLGVNLIASSVTELNTTPFSALIIGIILTLISISYFIALVLGNRTKRRKYEGLFVFDRKKKKLITIPRYEFSETLSRCLHHAFVENHDIKLVWDKSIPTSRHSIDTVDIGENKEELNDQAIKQFLNAPDKNLIKEATEYFLIDELSLHLSGFFNNKFKQLNLQQFHRQDIPTVLISNRFLDLFSRPMKERSAFLESDNHIDSEAIYSSTEKGALFREFQLILPKGSTIDRIGEDTIKIDTKKFSISFGINYYGLSAVLPRFFERYYLGLEKHSDFDLDVREITLSIKVSFKLRIFSGVGLDYYRWIDSFLERLNKVFSTNEFLEEISWNEALTIIQYMDMHNLNDVFKNKIGKNSRS